MRHIIQALNVAALIAAFVTGICFGAIYTQWVLQAEFLRVGIAL